MTTHKMLLVSTGGTIAGNVAEEKQGIQDTTRKAQDFSKYIEPTKDHFQKIWGIDLEIDTNELCDVDSSDILPENWTELVDLVVRNYDKYDSFIITHGTNTMGYTCAALTFAMANLNKPVILTGSQVPSGMPGTDALTNLNNAIRVALWPHQPTIKGVVAVFGSHIITGCRVKKSTEFDYDAFTSFTSGSIGRIGRIVNINVGNLNKHLSYLESKYYNMALTARDLIIKNEFDTRIVSLTEFPGMSRDIFSNLVDHCQIKGFVFRAFGAGDVSHHLHPGLEYLKEKEIPIVVTTQAPNGNSNMQVNEPGQKLLKNRLAIPAYDMSIESQTTKLAWLLAQKNKGDLTYKDVCREMTNDIRGEINVLKELKQ